MRVSATAMPGPPRRRVLLGGSRDPGASVRCFAGARAPATDRLSNDLLIGAPRSAVEKSAGIEFGISGNPRFWPYGRLGSICGIVEEI